MQDTADTEIQVQLVSEVEGEVKRTARAQPLSAIVITRSGPVQFMPLVRLISELRSCELSEVAPRLVNSSGIILRDATPEEVEAASEEFRRQDVPFVLISTGKLPELTEVAQLFRVRVGASGIRLRRDDGRHVDVKWKNVLTVTCVRLKRQIKEGTEAPARLILSIFTRNPFACYQLTENIASGVQRFTRLSHQPNVRFERVGRAIYETFPHAAQNKGMRILANYGVSGKWKGLTFEKLEQAYSYNYWLAVLRRYQSAGRPKTEPRFSIPWLRRIEFEPEAKPAYSFARYRVRPGPVPAPVRERPPIVVVPPQDWMPEVTRQVSARSTWLNVASLIAAICLAVYIILEVINR
jgi:hypothetical protein